MLARYSTQGAREVSRESATRTSILASSVIGNFLHCYGRWQFFNPRDEKNFSSSVACSQNDTLKNTPILLHQRYFGRWKLNHFVSLQVTPQLEANEPGNITTTSKQKVRFFKARGREKQWSREKICDRTATGSTRKRQYRSSHWI